MNSKIREKFSELGKREKFLAILGLIAVLGVLLSIATKVSLLHEDEDSLYRIAVVGPGSDQEYGVGRSLRQGVEYYADIVNSTGGIEGTSVAVDYYQDNNDPETARKIAQTIAEDSRNRAVVGHWSSAAAIAAGEVYEKSGIPLVTSASLNPESIEANQWLFTILYNNRKQARFLANYGRNVLGQKLVSVVYTSSAESKSLEEDFAATYKRFGTKVHYRWEIDQSGNVESQLQTIASDLKSKKDAGMLFLALDEDLGARLLTMLRDARIRNPVIGPNALGAKTFADNIEQLSGDRESVARYSDRMLV